MKGLAVYMALFTDFLDLYTVSLELEVSGGTCTHSTTKLLV